MRLLVALLLIALPAMAQVRGTLTAEYGDYSQLADVFPGSTLGDVSNGGRAKPVVLGEPISANSCGERSPDGLDIGLGQLCIASGTSTGNTFWMQASPGPVASCGSFGASHGPVAKSGRRPKESVGLGMLCVPNLGQVLKVVGAAVRFDAVDMVYLYPCAAKGSNRTRPNERFRNHYVYGARSSDMCDGVSVPVGLEFDDERSAVGLSLLVQAFDTTKIRDLVASLEPNDRAPFFASEIGCIVVRSHVSPPSKESVVRAGVGVSAPRRPAYCTLGIAS